MWHGCGIGVMSFRFKAVGRQLTIAPIAAERTFNGKSHARLHI
jgi:hypothetical protein